MGRKKVFQGGFVTFTVKLPQKTWQTMRIALAEYNWPLIVRELITAEVRRLGNLKSFERKGEPTRVIAARVLKSLAEGERQCDVGRELNLSKQRVCNIVKLSIKRGLLSKSDDGYALTEKGKKFVEA